MIVECVEIDQEWNIMYGWFLLPTFLDGECEQLQIVHNFSFFFDSKYNDDNLTCEHLSRRNDVKRVKVVKG